MILEDILIGNRMIAEMVHSKISGFFIFYNAPGSNSTYILYTEYSARYHDSIDWIMEALKKVDKLGFYWHMDSIINDHRSPQKHSYCLSIVIGSENNQEVSISVLSDDMHKSAFTCLWEFSSWYKENKDL